MPILADCHLHSSFSADSDTPMETMIQEALSKGLKTITFTEHNDFNFPCDDPSSFELNGDSFLFDLLKYREKYMGQIEVLYGVEIGLQKDCMRQNIKLTKDYDFDFVIGSLHVINGQDPYYPAFFEGRSDEECYREYFETLMANLRTFSNFDSLGHLDYIVRYGKSKDQDYSYSKYADLIDPILKSLIERDKALEINTGGLADGLKDTNPCIDIVKRYRELGGELITIGSDAHDTAHIGYRFDRAYEILKACGFEYYTVFCGRTPELRKLF